MLILKIIEFSVREIWSRFLSNQMKFIISKNEWNEKKCAANMNRK